MGKNNSYVIVQIKPPFFRANKSQMYCISIAKKHKNGGGIMGLVRSNYFGRGRGGGGGKEAGGTLRWEGHS